jgi:hypothetical protein
MAEVHSITAEGPSLSGTGLFHGSPLNTSPVRRDSGSSDGSHKYSPLEPGRWIVNVHGKCPRCNHHHSAVKVKVKVARNGDASQVSNVHCENCNQKWAAFGVRNATEISLLSATTTEPDPLEREVHYRLVNIVRAATAVASLGGIPELSTHVPSRQPSIRSPVNDVLHTIPQSPNLTSPHAWTNDATSPAQPGYTNAVKHRNSVRRFMSRIKKSMNNGLHFLQRDHSNITKFANMSNKPEMSTRQFEKSPVRATPADDRSLNLDTTMDSNAYFEDGELGVDKRKLDKHSVSGTLKRDVEVDEFMESLDTTGLESMSGHERSSWMRKTYTAFKARKKSLSIQLVMSDIMSIYHDPPRSRLSSTSHRPDELRYTGPYIEGLDGIDPNNTPTWRPSITISERSSEALTALDGISVASCPQCSRRESLPREGVGLRPQRPVSMPNVHQPLEHLPHVRAQARYSYDSFRQGRSARVTSTVRGRASRHRSRTSMSHLSRSSDHERSMSQTSQSRSLFREPQRGDQSIPPPAPAPGA